MADEGLVVFDSDARRRIRETVRTVHGGDDQIGRGRSFASSLVRFIFQIKLGKADSSITKGTSGTVSEYKGTTAGSESDTGTNYTCYNRFADISSGKWVIFFRWFGHWEIIQAEC